MANYNKKPLQSIIMIDDDKPYDTANATDT